MACARARSTRGRTTGRSWSAGSSRSPRNPPAAARFGASMTIPRSARSSWSSRAAGPGALDAGRGRIRWARGRRRVLRNGAWRLHGGLRGGAARRLSLALRDRAPRPRLPVSWGRDGRSRRAKPAMEGIARYRSRVHRPKGFGAMRRGGRVTVSTAPVGCRRTPGRLRSSGAAGDATEAEAFLAGLGGGDAQLASGGRAGLADDDVDVEPERGQQPEQAFERVLPEVAAQEPCHVGL